MINLSHTDLNSFLDDFRWKIISQFKNTLKSTGYSEMNVICAIKFSALENDTEIEEIRFFNIKNENITEVTNIDEWYDNKIKQQILSKVEDF